MFALLAGYQHHLHQFFPALPRDAISQTPQPWRGHPHAVVDLYEIFPSFALRRSLDCHALLYLRRHRNAGNISSFLLPQTSLFKAGYELID